MIGKEKMKCISFRKKIFLLPYNIAFALILFTYSAFDPRFDTS